MKGFFLINFFWLRLAVSVWFYSCYNLVCKQILILFGQNCTLCLPIKPFCKWSQPLHNQRLTLTGGRSVFLFSWVVCDLSLSLFRLWLIVTNTEQKHSENFVWFALNQFYLFDWFVFHSSSLNARFRRKYIYKVWLHFTRKN